MDQTTAKRMIEAAFRSPSINLFGEPVDLNELKKWLTDSKKRVSRRDEKEPTDEIGHSL